MKTLVIYYSRTGNTEKIALEIAKTLKCESEKIIDLKNRGGILGWFGGGKDGMSKKLTSIGKMKTNPADYDLVILGTPIWVNTPPAMRTYLSENAGKFKKAAFFCTMGGSNPEKLFAEMEDLSKVKPLATLAIKTDQVKSNSYQDELNKFIQKVI